MDALGRNAFNSRRSAEMPVRDAVAVLWDPSSTCNKTLIGPHARSDGLTYSQILPCARMYWVCWQYTNGRHRGGKHLSGNRQTEWRVALPALSKDHSSHRPYFLIVTVDIKRCCRRAISPAGRRRLSLRKRAFVSRQSGEITLRDAAAVLWHPSSTCNKMLIGPHARGEGKTYSQTLPYSRMYWVCWQYTNGRYRGGKRLSRIDQRPFSRAQSCSTKRHYVLIARGVGLTS